MIKILVLLIATNISGLLYAQSIMSCCAPSATETFAMNASDKSFVRAHEEPIPFIFHSTRGRDISYKTSDGQDAHAWEIKSAKSGNYYLFVIHEWWGLNGYIKQEAEKLAKELNINVIALDLYDKKIATTREDASTYTQSVKTERATSIIEGAYDYVGRNMRVFTVGWCFGGGWSLQAALQGGTQAAGCVIYYGQPEKNVEKLATLNCEVLGIFADKDQWITPAVVNEFIQNMQSAGKKLTVHAYNADHAFANPSNPAYDKSATIDAHEKTIQFIKERMQN